MRRHRQTTWSIAIAMLLITTAGCPPSGHYGRIILVNESDGALKNLTVSAPDSDFSKTWLVTEKGQAWTEHGHGRFRLKVTWDDAKDEHHEAAVSFKSEADVNSKQDLIIFVKDQGHVDWKLAGWRSHDEGSGEEDRGMPLSALYFLVAWTTLIAIASMIAELAILRCKAKPGGALKFLLTVLLLHLFCIMSFTAIVRWNSIIW